MRREDFEKRFQETIHMIQRRFQVLVQQSSDVFEIISPDGTIQYISPAVEKIVGYRPEERIGKNALEFFKGKEKLNFSRMIKFVIDNPDKKIDGDITLKTNEGKDIYLTLVMSNHISEPSIHGIVINWRDITERIEKQRELEYVATHDELTKLPNRVNFKKKMNQLCEGSKENDNSFALIMLDIDGFKYINDALGHQLGDQLIISVGQRLKAFTARGKYLCRYSGDQFAIIVKGLNAIAEYESIVKDIANLFQSPFKVDMYELEITISIGISIYPDDEMDADRLINYANIALLRSKQEGKNRHEFYSSDIGIETYKQLILRNDLIKAIEKDQIKVFYQPLVNLQTSEILAAEALIRWEHPDCGMVSPNEFISLAEETGFIINLGNWMLREVCKNYSKWLADGLRPIKVSVNYSSIQFFEKNFVENIIDTIEEYQLNPHFLIMEITESVFMKNPERAISDIQRLQAYGIQVALDDFGTGFSSLAYLNTFNIDILKVDRSFIKNALLDEASDIITRSVIDLARALKIKLVAEGVENWEQLSYLRKLNCYTGQGFLYKKPMPPKEFEKVLAEEKCMPIQGKDEAKPKSSNKRKYHRIKLPQSLEADMSISKVEGQNFKVENTKVQIKNIGAGGMCFASNVRLPINKGIVLQVDIPQLNKNTKLYGHPVWMQEVDENLYEYGMELTLDKDKKSDLTSALYTVCKAQYTYN